MERTAIVTGAARGIGAAIARRLAADGCRVAVLDVDIDACQATVDLIEAETGTALAHRCDVTDAEAVAATVNAVTERLGAPTILINNAGIIRDDLLFRMSVTDWDSVMSVHLRGAFLMTREVQRHQVAAGWGRVVNLSSTSALGNRGQVNYSAAKAGIQGFTKTLALELGPYGVTANAIAPGVIETAMTEATAARLGIEFDDLIAGAAADIPVRRVGQPADVAAAASFFCSEEAGYVSGQVLYVSGGPAS